MNALDKAVICIVGLGYVGLPLAEAFSKSFEVIGFDTDGDKVKKLSKDKHGQKFLLTDNYQAIGRAEFIIICVPTPVTRSKEPDLSYIRGAAEVVGRNMKQGSVVILESTVYPGITEEMVKPILERESGLECGRGFKIAYSPERINPGDSEHSIETVTKVVAGIDKETTELVAQLYSKITPHIFKARDIKTAEAAKVIENIQRDLNIALVNELALIFERMGLNTKDVLDTAATKWNFHRYSPGMVGGHCIPVDPYYLVQKAVELDYNPQVILAGRAINDSMPAYVAEMTVKALKETGKTVSGSRVLLMGLTYKENVADTRESPVKGIIAALRNSGAEVYGYDPLLDDIEDEFKVEVVRSLRNVQAIDAVIIAVCHDAFRSINLGHLKKVMGNRPILIDVRQAYDREAAEGEGFYYQTL